GAGGGRRAACRDSQGRLLHRLPRRRGEARRECAPEGRAAPRPRGRAGRMTVANLITLCRILLIPVFAFLWWRGLHVAALVVFGFASLSDWLDGFFARLLNQRTRLGQILDPAADKLM